MSETDFQPASYEGKPRHLADHERAALRQFWEAAVARLEEMSPDELGIFIAACRHVSPINCAWLDYAVAEMLYHVAIERRDRDGTLRRPEGAEGEACQPGPCEDTASPN